MCVLRHVCVCYVMVSLVSCVCLFLVCVLVSLVSCVCLSWQHRSAAARSGIIYLASVCELLRVSVSSCVCELLCV